MTNPLLEMKISLPKMRWMIKWSSATHRLRRRNFLMLDDQGLLIVNRRHECIPQPSPNTMH